MSFVLRSAVFLLVSAGSACTGAAQASPKRQIGLRTPQDSLRTLRQQAHDDTLAFRADSAGAVHDSVQAKRLRGKLIPLTPALLTTAFRDARARTLLTRARATRLTLDSTLTSYDATTYERLSVGLSTSRSLRERLLLRTERASRVQWRRESGAVVDITGARSVTPMLGQQSVDVGDQVPVPYFPGRDVLWAGFGIARANVSDEAILNPLANGAEAYYTYASGDSLTLQLSGRQTIVVRELRVQPRTSRWNVVIGSLWIDVASGQIARAIYRLATPMDLQAAVGADGSAPNALERMFLPSMTAQLTVITIDYGLFEGRFWLPRSQTADGQATVGGLQVPVHIQQRFDYASVNEAVSIPAIQINPLDTASTLSGYLARSAAHRRECPDTSGQRARTHHWYDKTLAVVIHTPCDSVALARSPTLPPSIYSSTDTLFDEHERAALVDDALGLGRAAAFDPQPATVHYGLGYTRYNRIEGPSTAIGVQKIYGAGYTGNALLRFGIADRSPTGELSLARTNGREAFIASAYRRLSATNDWGNPFSLGASLTALLFGRDDGMYYRTWGGELVHTQSGGLFDLWRLFAERQSAAVLRSQFSLASAHHSFGGNINAIEGSVAGLALRRRGALGEDPNGFRAQSNVRMEGAVGSFDYVRGMVDVTVDRPLTAGLSGALTLSGGTSGGTLPTQRLWYLGGAQYVTVPGQPIGAAVGNAYWLTRAEVGRRGVGVRPVVFAGLGWAGDRTQWTTTVRPISGAGVGASLLDGLLRVEVAKGIRPTHAVQLNAYFDAQF